MTYLKRNPLKFKTISFKFSLTLGLILFFFIFILIIAFVIFPEYKNILIFSSALLGAGGTIYSALTIAQNIKLTNLKDALKHSFDISLKIISEDLMESREFLNKHIMEGKIPNSEIPKFIMEEKSREQKVILILNYFEGVATSIKYGMAEEKYLYDFLQYFLIVLYERTKPYIEQKRILSNYPDGFIELENLYNSWRNKVYYSNGEKIK
jgi:hypothetical protein